MIMEDHIPQLVEKAKNAQKVLDVGGWYRPFNMATHVMDILPYDTRQAAHALDPENAERFTKDTWHIQDICAGGWPYEDKSFDFAFCSHTLEDVRDPLTVCKELVRVARAGYIEFPSRAREIFVKNRFSTFKKVVFQTSPWIGFLNHHRWFCEVQGNHVIFTAKTPLIGNSRRYYITREELGRKMAPAESGAFLWWDNSFTFEEKIELNLAKNYTDFKKKALHDLKKIAA